MAFYLTNNNTAIIFTLYNFSIELKLSVPVLDLEMHFKQIFYCLTHFFLQCKLRELSAM